MSGDIYDEFVRKFEKHKERSDYYWEQKDYRQSLEETIESFENYAFMLSTAEKRDEIALGGSTPRYGIESKINVLITIASILQAMAVCYLKISIEDGQKIEEEKKCNFQRKLLQRDMIEISLILKEHEKDMTVEQLNEYKRWEEHEWTRLTKKSLESKNLIIEEAVKEKNIDKYIDSNIKKIYTSFNRICKLELCLLSTRELPGSSDFNWQSSLLSLIAFGIAFLATGQNIIAGIVAAVICWIVVSAIKGSDS